MHDRDGAFRGVGTENSHRRNAGAPPVGAGRPDGVNGVAAANPCAITKYASHDGAP